MKELATDVHMLSGFPPNAINVYLVGDVLIDAATRQARAAHPASAARANGNRSRPHPRPPRSPGIQPRGLRAAGDPAVVRAGRRPRDGEHRGPQEPQGARLAEFRAEAHLGRAPHPVARALHEGDEVAGFTVLETPGHSAGHVSYWRESDRVLIVGDVLGNMNFITGIPGLNTPPDIFTPDPARNRESARRLAALRPALACFGHGAPLRDPGKLADFVARLPR